MSYIFRLHKEGINVLNDWGNSSKYGSNVIEQIQDPNGESAKREITSIPSPFARIDLVKTAFAKVAAMGVEGNTIHHKMVSDALDIGQVFFEYDKYAKQFEIIVWDKQNALNELLDSRYQEHRQLGSTYDIYLKQDGAMYNFDRMDRMFLLNFKNGPAMTNIIGATSPATLFFTSANDLSYVGEAIRIGNDRLFDHDYNPLFKRDFEYQKFWYLLRIVNREFPRLFEEVNKYLDENFNKMPREYQEVIRSMAVNAIDDYADVEVSGAGNLVYIINQMKMKQKVQDSGAIERSGFVIKSDYRIDGKKPLVLPMYPYTKPTLYTYEAWDRNTKVPFANFTAMKERTLPDDGAVYPYITVSDFLTDTIVRMPYEINKEMFFDGNLDKENGKSYLLPLTDLFFKFFTVEQLMGTLSNGKRMFELQYRSNGVKAILRIPVAQDVIEYERYYFEGNIDVSGIYRNEDNDGAILDKKFGLGILPLIKFPEKVQKHYRIALFDKGINNVTLHYFNGNNLINSLAHVIREPKDLNDNVCSIESYVINNNFDHIAVQVGEKKGMIVPKFRELSGNTEFTFAVDFGTTNSHIEYSTSRNYNPASFDILANEKQLHRLHKTYSDQDISYAFENNFIPDSIDDSSQQESDHFHSFPMRTVFSEHKKIDYDKVLFTLADGNIPFLYEKDAFPEYSNAQTNLKWDPKIEKLISMYLENIFIMMRNKVLINNGNLEKTKIVWFYPASMSEAKVNKLNKTWKLLYVNYFGSDIDNVINMSESTAPYYYYSKKQGAKSAVVTIDIGGGTTDVYAVENTEPKMLMSFRFAANTLFGDGYSYDSDNNGFVSRYKDKFLSILQSPDMKVQELAKTLLQIEAKKNSSDIIAFLFSLATNKKIKGNTSLNFTEELSKDDQMRWVIIIFYAAILYFIAQTMKKKGLRKPLTLAFSGNGAKTLWILSDDKDMVARFAKLIFDEVFGDSSGIMEVIMEENPKKATCKGGILEPVKQDYDTIDNVKYTPVGNNFNNESLERIVNYSDITQEVKEDIVGQINHFFDLLFNLHRNNKNFLSSKLSADENILKMVQDICYDNIELRESLDRGFDEKMKEVDGDHAIEETLFFYPLIGLLNKLAREINKCKPNSN